MYCTFTNTIEYLDAGEECGEEHVEGAADGDGAVEAVLGNERHEQVLEAKQRHQDQRRAHAPPVQYSAAPYVQFLVFAFKIILFKLFYRLFNKSTKV